MREQHGDATCHTTSIACHRHTSGGISNIRQPPRRQREGRGGVEERSAIRAPCANLPRFETSSRILFLQSAGRPEGETERDREGGEWGGKGAQLRTQQNTLGGISWRRGTFYRL